MVALFSIVLFTAAFGVSVCVIALAVGPQWRRIARLAMGNAEEQFAPLAQLAAVERRIAVRRWASAPVPAPIRRLRAAA